MKPLSFELLIKTAHELGLVTGASVHAFNRWLWAESTTIDGVTQRLPLDALAVKYGSGASKIKNLMDSFGYHLLDRQDISYPPKQIHNAGAIRYTPIATIVRLKINKSSHAVQVEHHSWLECGRVLVPELVEGQVEGGIAMGIGHALMEGCHYTKMVQEMENGTFITINYR